MSVDYKRSPAGSPIGTSRARRPSCAISPDTAEFTSQMGTVLTGDPREVALRDALYDAVGATVPTG